MRFIWGFVVLVFASQASAGGLRARVEGLYPLSDRKFTDEKTGFQPRADKFTLQNAFWLSVASHDAYLDEKEVLGEFQRWGFTPGTDRHSEDQLQFLSKNREATVQLLKVEVNVPFADSQAIWAENEEMVILAFRGTTLLTKADTITNLRYEFHDTRVMGTVHLGFWAALEVVWRDLYRKAIQVRSRDFAKHRKLMDEIVSLEESEWDARLNQITEWPIPLEGKRNFVTQWKRIRETALDEEGKEEVQDSLLQFMGQKWKARRKPIWIAGHSLGGGLAQVAAARLLKKGFNVAGLYTFGAPRVGDRQFAHQVEKLANEAGIRENVVRFVNDLDAITRLPPLTGIIQPLISDEGWKHIGRLKYFPEMDGAVPDLLMSDEDLENVPHYLKDMPLEEIGEWLDDHRPEEYAARLEMLVYGSLSPDVQQMRAAHN